MGVESMGRRATGQEQAQPPVLTLPPVQLPIQVVVDQDTLTDFGNQLRDAIVGAVTSGMGEALAALTSDEAELPDADPQ